MFSSSKVRRVEILVEVDDEAISLAREGWIEEDEEEGSFKEFAWSKEMLGLAELEEAEDIVSEMLIREVILS